MSPLSTNVIRDYHAHIYFRTGAERALALAIRDWLGQHFAVRLGRVHDRPVGPHGLAMYQVAFEAPLFAALVPWLALNRQGLSVLVHPNTGRDRDDHLLHALWLGSPMPLRAEVLSNGPANEDAANEDSANEDTANEDAANEDAD